MSSGTRALAAQPASDPMPSLTATRPKSCVSLLLRKLMTGFLLILLSSPIYTSPAQISTAINPPLSHLVHSLERRLVLSLLCSLLNTSLAVSKPNTVGAIPYNHLISKAAEEKAVLVRACLMSLLVALDYTLPAEGAPEMGWDNKEDNAFRYFVSKLVSLLPGYGDLRRREWQVGKEVCCRDSSAGHLASGSISQGCEAERCFYACMRNAFAEKCARRAIRRRQ